MKTRDALLEVIGNRAAQDTLEAAGWRRRDGEWLPPAEEPKPLTWNAFCLKGSIYFPWGREIVDDNAPALTWSISDPLSGSWKCQGAHISYYGDLYYTFQYVPATPYSIVSGSETVFKGQGPTGRVTAGGKITFSDPEFPGITLGTLPNPLHFTSEPEMPAFVTASWLQELKDMVDRHISYYETCTSTGTDALRQHNLGQLAAYRNIRTYLLP